MRGKATGDHRPLPRDENFVLNFPISPYTSKSQNVTLFCWMSHNQSRIVSGESASKRLKNRVKSVAGVFPHLINSARSYMTFLPYDVPQSIILIRLDVTSSF